MRVGIITFHKALNFGAALQATALNEYIDNNICQSEIIDFIPNNQVPKKNIIIRKILHKFKSIVYFKENKYRELKEKKFKEYRNKYMKLSEKTYYGDNALKKDVPRYDIYISGSDQILNSTLSGNSKSYYLSFIDGVKKISYASSFGRENITDFEKKCIGEELIKFQRLSVRESNGMNIIKEYSSCSSTLVLDPVFLLDKEKWRDKCKETKFPSKYILVYAMEYSNIMEEFILLLKSVTSMPVYLLAGSETAKKLSGNKCMGFGPSEFLFAINNAEYVITNSFHGTAFSMIFGKKFYCIAHTTRNIRINNLLELVNYERKIIRKKISVEILSDYLIDGDIAYQRLK
ncbi:MAG: polysaccharide pyruvyl transferase family protein, partial [Clostridium paraputrificum]